MDPSRLELMEVPFALELASQLLVCAAPSASTYSTDTITTTWILSLDYKVKLCRLNNSIRNIFEH